MNRVDSAAGNSAALARRDGSLTKSTLSRTGAGSTRKSVAKPAKGKAAAPKKAAVAKTGKKPPAKRNPKSAAAKTVRKPIVAPLEAPASSAMLDLVLARLDDMKAEQTVVIDMRGRSLFADHMVITSGRSNRHVASIAETVASSLKENGYKSVHVEGLTNADWVLIDTGEVTVHVFRPEVREFYNLERLWAHGPEPLARPA